MRVRFGAAVAMAHAVSSATSCEPLPWEWFDALEEGEKAKELMRRVNGERAVVKRQRHGGI